jgi:hypothetical protein
LFPLLNLQVPPQKCTLIFFWVWRGLHAHCSEVGNEPGQGFCLNCWERKVLPIMGLWVSGKIPWPA